MEIIEIQIPNFVPTFTPFQILSTSILEGSKPPVHYTVDLFTDDEQRLRDKVSSGAVFRFLWSDGNTYELPVSTLHCFDQPIEDVFGQPTVQRVCRLQVIMFGDLSNFLTSE